MENVITGKDNRKIKLLKNLLQKASARKEIGKFAVEGIKMVNEAVELNIAEEIFVSESFYKRLKSTEEGFRFKNVKELNLVNEELFKKISETVTPQGIIAVVKCPKYELTDEEFLRDKYEKRGSIRLAFLEDIADPGNLGTIFRTAEAAGMTGIIMSRGTADVFNPKTVRSTMGSIFRLPFTYVEDTKKTLSELKRLGVKIYAAHLKGTRSYKEIDYGDKSAVMIGNEARGLNEETAKLSDVYIKIPMEGKAESLNAAVAGALIMYEMCF